MANQPTTMITRGQGERSGDNDALALTTGDLPRQHVELRWGTADRWSRCCTFYALGDPDSVDVKRVDERSIRSYAG